MKNIVEFLNEQLQPSAPVVESTDIKDEKQFREYAEKKFKEAFKDDFDEDKMKETVDGLLKDNKELVDNGDWGALVGILNKSFGE
jgi:hypothetical protein